MPTLELTDDQVVDLVKQLPPDRQAAALAALANGGRQEREARIDRAQERIRAVCRERGLDWDAMSEEERENFIDDLIHEDRPCAP